MRTMLWAAALATVLLAGCGGGSSSSSSSSGGLPPRPGLPNAPAAPAITVTAMRAPIYSSADCPRLVSTRASVAALDLREVNIRAVNAFLLDVDPDAHAVFARRPYDFINWIAMLGGRVDLITVGTATHETIHQVTNVLRECEPVDQYKALFMGNVLETGVMPGDTPSMRVVANHIDPALVGEPRYDTYITDAVPGNDLSILLDEFAAYTTAAHTEFQMLASRQTGGFVGALDGNLGGTVNFMVYLQSYLKALRLDYPAAHRSIRDSARTVAAIQAIWSRAELTLRDSYEYVDEGVTFVNAAYLEAAYSAALLGELDAIGVTHASRSAWSATYLP
ncbi:MAG: hypothetical protein ACO1PB_12005 [Ramlibacter sp.]